MMKRATRTIDVSKLRRNLKSRGRIGDTVCCGSFSGLAYLKLVLLWLSCIALDLLIGFRFELLYPLWLLIRNCYDSFRFQGLVTSLQYSAFSAFFVCATVTVDLICFVLLPVQLVFFLASTYVWILLVWQTADRGIGSTQLLLWLALISFEYNWRYRGDSPLQLLRSSTLGSTLNFLTGGLLSNWLGLRDGPGGGGDTGGGGSELLNAEQQTPRECHTPARVTGSFLGSFGVALTAAFAHSTSLTSDLCRPFAAHCIGYPVVTLGFGLKTYISLWRVRKRQREVSRANEVYCKLLTEALPSLYEGPKIYSCCNRASINDQEHIEYETEICQSSVQNLAICPSPSSVAITHRKNPRVGAGWKQNGWKQQHSGKRMPVSSNGGAIARKDRTETCLNNDDDDTASSASLTVRRRRSLWRLLWELLMSAVVYAIGTSGLVGDQMQVCPSLDDRMSISSNEIESEDELLEHDENLSQPDELLGRISSLQRSNNTKKNKGLVPSLGGCTRAKTGRSRARNVQSTRPSDYVMSQSFTSSSALSPSSSSSLGASCAFNNNLLNLANGNVSPDSGGALSVIGNAATAASVTTGFSTNTGAIVDTTKTTSSSKSANEYTNEEVETLRNDLRTARCQETESRYLLQQSANTEKQLKAELSQLKLKQEQIENKLSGMMKAREQDKSSMQLLEKRLIEAQTKKNELEKELNAEKRSKIKEEHAAARALAAAQMSRTVECGEACKTRRADMEREIRTLRRDMKAKEELTNAYEDQLRQLRQYKDSNDLQDLQASVKALREKNAHLEKSLSSENRLKQELFRALSEARTQMEELQQQMRLKDANLRMKEAELMSFGGRLSSDVPNDNAKLSATAGDGRTPLTMVGGSNVSRCVAAPNSLLSPVVNGVGNMTKSAIGTDQTMEMYSTALSNQNNAYMPYHFAQNEPNHFETSVTQTVRHAMPSNSGTTPPPLPPQQQPQQHQQSINNRTSTTPTSIMSISNGTQSSDLFSFATAATANTAANFVANPSLSSSAAATAPKTSTSNIRAN